MQRSAVLGEAAYCFFLAYDQSGITPTLSVKSDSSSVLISARPTWRTSNSSSANPGTGSCGPNGSNAMIAVRIRTLREHLQAVFELFADAHKHEVVLFLSRSSVLAEGLDYAGRLACL